MSEKSSPASVVSAVLLKDARRDDWSNYINRGLSGIAPHEPRLGQLALDRDQLVNAGISVSVV